MTTPTPPPVAPQPAEPVAPAGWSTPDPPSASSPLLQVALVAVAVTVGGAVTFMLLGARPGAHEAASGVVSGRPTAGSATTATPPIPVRTRSGWSRANEYRWVSNHKRAVAYELEADQQVKVWTTAVRPLLVVRCLGRKTEVFVYTETPARLESADENHTVGLALDRSPETAERWPDSEEHDALFAPDGTSLARRLSTASHLRFGFTPHNAPPVTVDFDLTGADTVVSKVASTCGWR
jgi:hypothetical protein